MAAIKDWAKAKSGASEFTRAQAGRLRSGLAAQEREDKKVADAEKARGGAQPQPHVEVHHAPVDTSKGYVDKARMNEKVGDWAHARGAWMMASNETKDPAAKKIYLANAEAARLRAARGK